MAFIGAKPTNVPLTANDITDGSISVAKLTSTLDLSSNTVTLPAGVGGKVLQVVTATDETSRTTSSTSYVTASNTLSVTITPTSTSSKIYVIMSTTVSSPSNTWAGHITIYRGATNLASDKFINAHGTSTYQVEGGAISVLDSPNTTSATTYQVYMKIQSGAPNGVTINHGSSKGTITAFEVAG